MPTLSFAALLPRVQPSVPGCPRPLVLDTIRDAAIRICEKSLAWRHVQTTFQLLPGVHEYTFNKPASSEVHAVFGAHVDSKPLQILTLEQALALHPEWADLYSGQDPSVVFSLTPSGAVDESEYNEDLFNEGSPFVLPDAIIAAASTPRSITQVTPDKFIVLPLPDDTYSCRMFYALKPSRVATGMEEAPMRDIEDAIVHWALQQLLVMPKVAWSDRELAAYHAKQALFRATEARARANLGNARGQMVVSGPPLM